MFRSSGSVSPATSFVKLALNSFLEGKADARRMVGKALALAVKKGLIKADAFDQGYACVPVRGTPLVVY